MHGHDPLAGALAPRHLRWLERGVLRVPQGHGGGLIFDMRYLPISHAHIGSIAFGNLESSVQEAMVRHLGPAACSMTSAPTSGFFSMLGAHLAGFEEGHVYAFEAAPENAEAIRRQRQAERDRQHHDDRQGRLLARRPRPPSGRRRPELVKARGLRRAPQHRAGDRGRAGRDRRSAGAGRAARRRRWSRSTSRGRRSPCSRVCARRSSAIARPSSASSTTPTPSSSRLMAEHRLPADQPRGHDPGRRGGGERTRAGAAARRSGD